MRLKAATILAACLLPIVDAAAAGDPAPAAGAGASMEFVENEFLRVGIDLRWGGAITHVSARGGPNIINSFDLGRQIQQSYYSGPPNYQREGRQKSPAWATFPWNPIQTGDAYRNGSRIVEHRVNKRDLYVKTIPMLWPMNNDAGECFMETSITLAPNAPKFLYRARLTNQRSDKTPYAGMHQEVPAVYVNGPWHKLVTYQGDKPFAGGEVSEIRNDHKEPWPWVNFLATEGWAALVNDAGSGIGVCLPNASEFHGGFCGTRGQGGEKSPDTGYMSPVSVEILDHNIVYQYERIFVIGTVGEIRAAARQQAATKPPSWTFENARQGWTYQNGRDGGWPITGKGLTIKADNPGNSVRMTGPFTFWQAAEAGHLTLRVSAPATATIKVFWRGMPPAAASTKPSEWAAWRASWWRDERSAAIPVSKGTDRLVNLTLAGLPSYQGGITGLALDVPDGVTIRSIRLDR